MSTPLDMRLREAIVTSHAAGLTYEEIATQLGVGEASVSRILRLHRENASVAPRPRGGGNFSPIQGEVADLFVEIVEKLPDATIDELTSALLEASVKTSRSSVVRALARFGFSRKKRPSLPSSETRPNAVPIGRRSART
jgi:transposase